MAPGGGGTTHGEFDRLAPSIQYHVVNTLGWPRLRPLQNAAIGPVLAGEQALLLAPTAGGKTEAAAFPLLSRMVAEQWAPTSVLYLAPLRALLNNLLPRLELYCGFVGRTARLWHGDTTQGARTRIMSDPPDVLLTTPESLESMLISRRVDHGWWFANLRAVVVDEVHAFAAGDRGWHLLAVLERLARLAGRDLQRIGLSATVGDPDGVLRWLSGSSTESRRVINPQANPVANPEVTLDHVGSLSNAGIVINRLHRGEKRLVFVDSRRRVEELAAQLRSLGTDTFVSHGSLGQDERRRSEQAFAEATDCVIVATSTLELGIDVGDLDRVVQIDAPSSVAAFLQRIGRTGRRAGTSRNALFLATSTDALLTSAGLLRLWAQGYIEPATPLVFPAHILVQQVLALGLQESDTGLEHSRWIDWLGMPPVLGAEVAKLGPELVDHLLATGWLHDDTGLLSPGPKAERTLGRRNFLELTSVFVSDPLFSVRQGRSEIGAVPDVALVAAFAGEGTRTLLLAGRSWRVNDVDWKRRVVHVEPSDHDGTIRFGSGAAVLSFEMAQSIAAVLAGEDPGAVTLTNRAESALAEARSEFAGVRPGRTRLFPSSGGQRWYTFAGLRANLNLAARLAPLRSRVLQRSNLFVTIDDGVDRDRLKAAVSEPPPPGELDRLVADITGTLKLEDALPDHIVTEILTRRMADDHAVDSVINWPVDSTRSVG